MGRQVSRRAILRGMAAGLAAGSAAGLEQSGLGMLALPGPAAQGSLRAPLLEFGYDQITLSGERQRAQLANVQSVMLDFNDDSLLQPFRLMSGRPGPGKSLGGWYEWKADYDYHHDDVGFCPGASFGQWVSAMARLHAVTGEPALGEKAVRLNGLLAETIAQGDFHAYFAKTRFPAYTFDKLVCGLMDAHRLAGDTAAFATLDKVRAAAEPELAGHAEDREVQAKNRGTLRDPSWSWDESYTMAENLYLVSTQMPPEQAASYRAMAVAYLDDAYFAPLARGENLLAGKHAYSYVNALCSAMQAYITGGSKMHLEAGRNGFDLLTRQSYATGGWGPDEQLRGPSGHEVETDLNASLTKTHSSFETPCGSYAHMKLTRYLLRSTGDGRYGDSMEQVMLNTVLGVLPLEDDGRSFYYADYNVVGKRVYSEHRWPCCSGTLPQVVADYGINSYFYQAGECSPQEVRSSTPGVQGGLRCRPATVWVNLYQPSTLRLAASQTGGARVAIEQSGSYPESGDIRLAFRTSAAVDLELKLRVPAWAVGGAQIRVNGSPLSLSARQGFVSVSRRWLSGDTIEMRLPMALRLEALPGHPEQVALLCGPLVLFPLRGPADGEQPLRMTRDALLGAERLAPRAWRVKEGSSERIFVPYTDVAERSFSTYVNVRSA